MELIGLLPFALVAMITWAIIKKRWGILYWMGACVAPALVVYLSLIAGLWHGEQALYGLILFGHLLTWGLIIFGVGLIIQGLRKQG